MEERWPPFCARGVTLACSWSPELTVVTWDVFSAVVTTSSNAKSFALPVLCVAGYRARGRWPMAAGLSPAEDTAQASQGPGRTAEPPEISKMRQIWAEDGNEP